MSTSSTITLEQHNLRRILKLKEGSRVVWTQDSKSPTQQIKVKVCSFLPEDTRSVCSKTGVSVQSPVNTKNPEDGVSFPLDLRPFPDLEGANTSMSPQNGDPPSHSRGNMGLVDPLQQVPRTINSLPAQSRILPTTCSWAASKQQI